MRGMDRVDSQKLFPPRVEESITRGGTGLRCEGQGLKEMYEASFLHREWWVPGTRGRGEVVKADTGRLDKYMNEIGIEGYGPRKGRGF